MAVFNPATPDVKGVNPIGWSHSADVPSSFASAATSAIKGIGDIIGLSVKAGDELIQQDAKKAALETVEPIRDDEIAKMAAIDFRTKLGLSESGGQSTASITDGDVKDLVPIPNDLKSDLKTMAILPEARANGRISPTDYYARLTSAASDLRSRYPVGYRDYIDKEISKITGVDPANAYLHSIIGDIDAARTNQQAQTNKILGEILELHGKDPTAPLAYQNFKNTGDTRAALDWINRVKAVDVNHTRRMQGYAEKEAGSKDAEMQAEQSFRSYGASLTATTLNNVTAVQGLTGQKIQDIVISQMHNPTMTSQQYIALEQEMRGFRASDEKKMIAELNFVDKDPKSPTYRPVPLAAALKDKGAKILADSLAGHDEIIKNLADKNFGLAHNAKRVVEAMQDDTAHVMFKGDPKAAVFFGAMKVFKDHAGNEGLANMIESTVKSLGGLPDIQNVAMQAKLMAMATAPDPRGPNFKQTNGVSETISQIGQESQQLGDNRYKAKAYEAVQNMIDGKQFSLIDPTLKPEVKREIVRNWFHPDQGNFLSKIKPDTKDPLLARTTIPGQESWFKRFTAPEVVQEIQKMDPEAQGWYRNSVETANQYLFANSLRSLGSRDLGNSPLSAGYVLKWDAEDRVSPLKIEIKNEAERRQAMKMFGNKPLPIEADLERVNKSITGLSSMYRGLGFPPDVAETEVLKSLNFSLKSYEGINGIPKKFTDVVRARGLIREAQKEVEDQKKSRAMLEEAGKRTRDNQYYLQNYLPGYNWQLPE